MVEIVCNLYEMEGISKVTSHISYFTSNQYLDISYISGHCREKCKDGVQPTWHWSGRGVERGWVCKRLLEGFFCSTTDQTVNFYNLVFRTQTCKTCSMGQQNDHKRITCMSETIWKKWVWGRSTREWSFRQIGSRILQSCDMKVVYQASFLCIRG